VVHNRGRGVQICLWSGGKLSVSADTGGGASKVMRRKLVSLRLVGCSPSRVFW